MHDLKTIVYNNAFAALVEEQKDRDDVVGEIYRETFPSEAPARPRDLKHLKQRDPELYREKAYLRRLALFRWALRRASELGQ